MHADEDREESQQKHVRYSYRTPWISWVGSVIIDRPNDAKGKHHCSHVRPADDGTDPEKGDHIDVVELSIY